MDHELFVGILHGGADFAKEPQTFVDRELILVAILVDGWAFDMLHDQIGRAVFAASAVEELHDVGMVESREGLALVAKSMENLLGIDSGLNHFDRNLLSIVLIVPLAEINDCHAAVADLAENAI